MYKGCIFDLDGTLLNTIDTIAYYGNAALKDFGIAPIETETYKRLVGNGAAVLVERMLAEHGIQDRTLFQQVYQRYTSLYDENPYAFTTVYDGINALIDGLKSAGLTLCVLSNKPHSATVPIIRRFFPADTFRFVYGAQDGVPKKPDPAMANLLLDKMGITASECLYVGDTNTDMQTGKAAGMYTIGVLWGFRGREELEKSHADFIATHPLDILSCIK